MHIINFFPSVFHFRIFKRFTTQYKVKSQSRLIYNSQFLGVVSHLILFVKKEHPFKDAPVCVNQKHFVILSLSNDITYLWLMQVPNKLFSCISIFTKEKMKYNTIPKWVKIADIALTAVYLIVYISALIFLVRWLMK